MSEHAHQVALFNWSRMHEKAHPELRLMYAIPNAAKRSKRQGAYMKAEGLRAGVPDVCLPVARQGFHALYIELKRPRTATQRAGTVSAAQSDMLDRLNQERNLAIVCYGWEEAAKAIIDYVGVMK